MIGAALDAGLNFIDTSNSYAKGECERIIGRALAASNRRHEAVIATKVFYPTGPGPNDRGGSRRHILQACEDSLRRLQTDHIDLYQTHRPDFDTPIEETLGALDRSRPPGQSPPHRQHDVARLEGPGGRPRQRAEGAGPVRLRTVARTTCSTAASRTSSSRCAWPTAWRSFPGPPWAWASSPAAIPTGSSFPERFAGRAPRRHLRRARDVPRASRSASASSGWPATTDISPAQLAVLWVKDQPGITAPIIGPRTLDQLEHFLPGGRHEPRRGAPEGLRRARASGERGRQFPQLRPLDEEPAFRPDPRKAFGFPADL